MLLRLCMLSFIELHSSQHEIFDFLVPRLTDNFTREYWTGRWDLSLGFLLKTSFKYALLRFVDLAQATFTHKRYPGLFYHCKIAHGGEHDEYPVTYWVVPAPALALVVSYGALWFANLDCRHVSDRDQWKVSCPQQTAFHPLHLYHKIDRLLWNLENQRVKAYF